MTTRLYLKENKNKKFQEIAKRLGAEYIEDEEHAIIIKNTGKWILIANYGSGDKDFSKPAIKVTRNGEVDVGCVRKSCMNFEDKSQEWYIGADIEWLVDTLQKVLKEFKK